MHNEFHRFFLHVASHCMMMHSHGRVTRDHKPGESSLHILLGWDVVNVVYNLESTRVPLATVALKAPKQSKTPNQNTTKAESKHNNAMLGFQSRTTSCHELLAIAGYDWLLLAPIGSYWHLLAIASDSFQLQTEISSWATRRKTKKKWIYNELNIKTKRRTLAKSSHSQVVNTLLGCYGMGVLFCNILLHVMAEYWDLAASCDL